MRLREVCWPMSQSEEVAEPGHILTFLFLYFATTLYNLTSAYLFSILSHHSPTFVAYSSTSNFQPLLKLAHLEVYM